MSLPCKGQSVLRRDRGKKGFLCGVILQLQPLISVCFSEKRRCSIAVRRRRFRIPQKMDIFIVKRTRAEVGSVWKDGPLSFRTHRLGNLPFTANFKCAVANYCDGSSARPISKTAALFVSCSILFKVHSARRRS